MYKRTLALPNHSFFLFGPRGTGKTTWLKNNLPDAKFYDLLRNRELLRLMRNPDVLRMEVETLPKGSWIVIDEVQKFPELLNEVHAIIADYGNDYLFALSGSSARKLKRLDANLLAGRIINRKFFPITGNELEYTFDYDTIIKFGMLPKVLSEPEFSIDILEAYVNNYLQQEVQQEAFVKNLGSFSRFLEIAALFNGQVVNISNIARDAGVARPTVERYFDVLVSTLIGTWLPAWRPKAKVKEIAHPKFYFFDTGVVRAIHDRLREPLDSMERGPLLETLILHELQAYQNVANCGGKFQYWRTPSQQEVDFIWKRGDLCVGIEVKSSPEWKRTFSTELKKLHTDGILTKAIGVYLGESDLKDGPVSIFPLKTFMRRLNKGEIIG